MKKFAILILLVWCVVVRADMINRYSFNDGDTAAVDSIGGKDGTLTNTATISGNKVVLDGSSAVNLPSDVLPSSLQSVTIEAWCQLGTASTWARLFDFGATDGGNGGNTMYFVPNNGGGLTQFSVSTTGFPSWQTGENSITGAGLTAGVYTHIVCVFDGSVPETRFYLDGKLTASAATTMDITKIARQNAFIGDSSYPGDPYFNGSVDEFRIYDTALTDEEVTESFNSGPDISLSSDMQAKKPNPKNSAKEVSIDVGEISWTPGENAIAQNGTHNVFFGTDKDSVANATVENPLGVMVSSELALDNNSVALDRLEYNTTYYWRVDEVNNPASTGTAKGKVWSFKSELKGYSILPANIINVTSLGGVYPDEPDRQDPNSTCTGAGLDANDMHSTNMKTMWLGMDEGAYLQYEFDKAYKLYDMLVWNYNEEAPNNEYFGAKDVKVEYSLDGENWTELADVPEFTMATGDNKCVANTDVLFKGTVAKYVKLTFLTGWGDLGLYGISEVRFSAEPTRAQIPNPEDKATNVKVDQELSWKPGRYSVDHNIYLGTDVNAVKEGTANMVTTSDASYVKELVLAKTYYWRVDEVNNAEAYPVWDGPVWSFSTAEAMIIDNFEEGYGASEVNFVWATWKDGVEVSANGGSEIGVGIEPPGLSTANRVGNGHSLSVTYTNSGASTYSQVSADSINLPISTTNWLIGTPTALVIWFRGDPNNTPAQLYVKLNDKKVSYDGEPAYLTQSVWRPFVVDLSKFNTNIGNISSITIGFENTGTGTVYIDDIALYGVAPVVVTTPVNPGNTGLIASYSMENNVQDGSGKGLNGTIVGAPTYEQGATGYGKALKFNGTTDCVDLGNKAEFNPAGSFSVSLWANITTWTSGWGCVMVGNRGEGTVGWQIRRGSGFGDTGNSVCFTTRNISNDDMLSNISPPLNEWINVTCVYENAAFTKTIYFDGSLIRTVNLTGTVTKIPATTHNTYIGARANSGNTGQEGFFTGLIDQVRIYNRALSAGEALYLSDPTP